MDDLTAITTAKGEPKVDSRKLAHQMEIQHKNIVGTVKRHKEDFEEFGKVAFQTEASPSGQSEKYYCLNENQAYLLLTYSKNTMKIRALKGKLIRAFSDARIEAKVRHEEYLPGYHDLHNAIKDHAAGSPNERFYHLNVNKTLNRLAGLQPGQRATAGGLKLSLLCIGAAIATKAITGDQEGTLHERIKNALRPLESLAALGVIDAS